MICKACSNLRRWAPGEGLEPSSPEGHQLARHSLWQYTWSRGWPLLGPTLTYLAWVPRRSWFVNWYCNLCLYQFRKLSLIATRVGLDDYYVTFPATIRNAHTPQRWKIIYSYHHNKNRCACYINKATDFWRDEELVPCRHCNSWGLADEFRDRLRELCISTPTVYPIHLWQRWL